MVLILLLFFIIKNTYINNKNITIFTNKILYVKKYINTIIYMHAYIIYNKYNINYNIYYNKYNIFIIKGKYSKYITKFNKLIYLYM